MRRSGFQRTPRSLENAAACDESHGAAILTSFHSTSRDGQSPAITPSRQNQRTPSLFAPSGAQLACLRRLLSGDEAAVGQTLAATMAYGLPIGPPKPAPSRQKAQQTRVLHRLLAGLDDLVQADAPARAARADRGDATPGRLAATPSGPGQRTTGLLGGPPRRVMSEVVSVEVALAIVGDG